MLLELNRTYTLKSQNPSANPILIELVSFKVSLMGPKGIVCMPARIKSTKEEVLLPITMLGEMVENINKKEY